MMMPENNIYNGLRESSGFNDQNLLLGYNAGLDNLYTSQLPQSLGSYFQQDPDGIAIYQAFEDEEFLR
jgi:hypothetical protein